MTTADRKRLAVLRNLSWVYGDQMYESSQKSRTVRTEVEWLLTHGFAERYIYDEERRVRITDAGQEQLTAWEAMA